MIQTTNETIAAVTLTTITLVLVRFFGHFRVTLLSPKQLHALVLVNEYVVWYITCILVNTAPPAVNVLATPILTTSYTSLPMNILIFFTNPSYNLKYFLTYFLELMDFLGIQDHLKPFSIHHQLRRPDHFSCLPSFLRTFKSH